MWDSVHNNNEDNNNEKDGDDKKKTYCKCYTSTPARPTLLNSCHLDPQPWWKNTSTLVCAGSELCPHPHHVPEQQALPAPPGSWCCRDSGCTLKPLEITSRRTACSFSSPGASPIPFCCRLGLNARKGKQHQPAQSIVWGNGVHTSPGGEDKHSAKTLTFRHPRRIDFQDVYVWPVFKQWQFVIINCPFNEGPQFYCLHDQENRDISESKNVIYSIWYFVLKFTCKVILQCRWNVCLILRFIPQSHF